MGRRNYERDQRRREQEQAEQERRWAEAQEEQERLERLDSMSLEYIIENETEDMEAVRYVLMRLAKTSALQTKLLKGLCE